MTTFTTEDRENASPPHVVDSGASVMSEKCPSCEYHKGSERIWRDFAKKQAEEIAYWKEKFEKAMELNK